MTLQEALYNWRQGHNIHCNHQSKSIPFLNGDDMLVLYKSDLDNTDWEAMIGRYPT